MKSKVAALVTRPETVLEDYDRLFDLAGIQTALDPKAETILKDNISWHLFFPGANTTPWQLEATIRKLRDFSEGPITCVENDTVVTDAFKGDRLNKFPNVLEPYGIKTLYNFRPEEISWSEYKPKADMLVLDKIYPEGITIPDYFFGKNVVHLPTVKTHIYTTTTCSMKNAFGGLLNRKRHYTHSVIHETLVDLLAIQKEIHSGIFAVADGTTCGNGPGPRTMYPEVKNIILASSDCVALDAVATKLMGFDPMSLPYINLAHNRGLGVGKPEDIEIVGEDISSWNFGFQVGDNTASRVGDAIWFGPFKKMQHLLFHTPIVYGFVFGSFFYHDYVWYPTIGKSRVKKWMNSPWGKLFERYDDGPLGK